jgi:hypothetical protein
LPRGGQRWRRYCELHRMHIKLAGKIGSLSTRLRLTQQQKYDPKLAYWLTTKNMGTARKPWETARGEAPEAAEVSVEGRWSD